MMSDTPRTPIKTQKEQAVAAASVVDNEVFDEVMSSVNNKLVKAGIAPFKTASDEDAGTAAPYYIRTGIPSLDYAVGGVYNPGIPGARLLEIYGAESHGKTTLALHILSKLMNDYHGKGLIQDAEQVLTLERIDSLGIDTDTVQVSQPETLESAFEAQEMVIDVMKKVNESRKKSGKPQCTIPIGIILDSVAACPTKAEFEGDYDQAHMAQQARVMSQGLKKIKGEFAQNGVMALYLNQIRDTMNSYGAKSDTPGGRALKFYAAVRMEVSRVEWLKKKEPANAAPYGMKIQVKVTKNKVAPPLRIATFEIRFDQPYVVDVYSAVLDWLKSNNLIGGGQGYYELEGKSRRKNEAVDILYNNEKLWAEMLELAYSLGDGAAQDVAEGGDEEDDE